MYEVLATIYPTKRSNGTSVRLDDPETLRLRSTLYVTAS